MTVFVRPLVDPLGDPLTIYRTPVGLSAGAAVSAASSISASAVVGQARTAAASVLTSSSIAASASVTVDLTSILVAGTNSTPGSLLIPAEDAAYKVTATNAALGGSSASPAVQVDFPTPANPAVSHWITVDYTIANRSRRFFHNLFNSPTRGTFDHVDGLVVEPSATVGATTRIRYTWTPATQLWTVADYGAGATVRNHGPVVDLGIKLSFSPELRAEAAAATYIAGATAAIGYIHPTTRAILGSQGVCADVVSRDTDGMLESLAHRGITNSTVFSGTVGRTTGRYSVAMRGAWPATPDGTEMQTLLHELGHAMDQFWLDGSGNPEGFNQAAGASYIYPLYWPDGVTIQYVVYYTADWQFYRLDTHDEAGVFLNSQFYEVTAPAVGNRLTGEQELIDMFTPIQDSGVYYRSNITEWFAQMCLCYWFDDGFGLYPAGLIPTVTNSTPSIYTDFVSYMRGIGAFPT